MSFTSPPSLEQRIRDDLLASQPGMDGTILGISFDGLEVSGIVNEFLHLAYAFKNRRYRVLLDLGFDITLRQGTENQDLIPPWVELVRPFGNPLPDRYTKLLIREAVAAVVSGAPITSIPSYMEISEVLAERLVATLTSKQVDILVIENGTLPDNPIATEALYLAIEDYGARRNLGKYVLWRDWDLMWSTEPHLYGKYPFPGVRKPLPSEHIHHAVATDWMRRRMKAWAPGVDYIIMPSRFFCSASRSLGSKSFRSAYSIPQDAYLVARCTRVIPQKSIDRDLRLFDQVQQRLNQMNDSRQLFLFITGPTTEDAEEFERLSRLQRTLTIADQVIWGNGLLPFNPLLINPASSTTHFSIQDLLSEADLSSFLTSYDYEGFGNPPGEAMASGIPFISTTYELYHDVYGSRGAIAPLLPIDRKSTSQDAIPNGFVEWVVQLLTDQAYRSQVIARNLGVCRRYFSLEELERQLAEIFNWTLRH